MGHPVCSVCSTKFLSPNGNGTEFTTTRISDAGIHRNIRKFHASVTAADPRLHEICQPTSRSHVTLDTLNIDDGAEQSVLDAVRRAVVASSEQGPKFDADSNQG